MKKIKCILLVDDDRATNFYHSIIIRDMSICEEVIQVKNGQEAFEFLVKRNEENLDLPEYIFIDRHMPILDGFEFIDKVDNADIKGKEQLSVILLSTLLSEGDLELVESYISRESVLKTCSKKPLTEEFINELSLV